MSILKGHTTHVLRSTSSERPSAFWFSLARDESEHRGLERCSSYCHRHRIIVKGQAKAEAAGAARWLHGTTHSPPMPCAAALLPQWHHAMPMDAPCMVVLKSGPDPQTGRKRKKFLLSPVRCTYAVLFRALACGRRSLEEARDARTSAANASRSCSTPRPATGRTTMRTTACATAATPTATNHTTSCTKRTAPLVGPMQFLLRKCRCRRQRTAA